MDPLLLRLTAVLVLLLVVAVLGRWWQQRVTSLAPVPVAVGPRVAADHLHAVGLDLTGARAGALLLGAPTCSPCGQVEQVLRTLAHERDDFRWVYADAADHLGIADDHAVRRVPTLFVLAPGGRILARTSGVPRADELRRVLDGEEQPV
jgi:hypothetical protein